MFDFPPYHFHTNALYQSVKVFFFYGNLIFVFATFWFPFYLFFYFCFVLFYHQIIMLISKYLFQTSYIWISVYTMINTHTYIALFITWKLCSIQKFFNGTNKWKSVVGRSEWRGRCDSFFQPRWLIDYTVLDALSWWKPTADDFRKRKIIIHNCMCTSHRNSQFFRCLIVILLSAKTNKLTESTISSVLAHVSLTSVNLEYYFDLL